MLLRTVNHLFRLGPSTNHGYVSHNQVGSSSIPILIFPHPTRLQRHCRQFPGLRAIFFAPAFERLLLFELEVPGPGGCRKKPSLGPPFFREEYRYQRHGTAESDSVAKVEPQSNSDEPPKT